MKIISLSASGYAGLKQPIDITFDKNIIRLSGKNGNGKSTILMMLNLESIQSDQIELDAEYFFETGKRKYLSDAKKNLKFEHKGIIYETSHTFSKSGTKKSYISSGSIEHNPNGNVTSYTTFISGLDITEGEIISNRTSKFLDLSPSERKLYISQFIDDISIYEMQLKNAKENQKQANLIQTELLRRKSEIENSTFDINVAENDLKAVEDLNQKLMEAKASRQPIIEMRSQILKIAGVSSIEQLNALILQNRVGSELPTNSISELMSSTEMHQQSIISINQQKADAEILKAKFLEFESYQKTSKNLRDNLDRATSIVNNSLITLNVTEENFESSIFNAEAIVNFTKRYKAAYCERFVDDMAQEKFDAVSKELADKKSEKIHTDSEILSLTNLVNGNQGECVNPDCVQKYKEQIADLTSLSEEQTLEINELIKIHGDANLNLLKATKYNTFATTFLIGRTDIELAMKFLHKTEDELHTINTDLLMTIQNGYNDLIKKIRVEITNRNGINIQLSSLVKVEEPIGSLLLVETEIKELNSQHQIASRQIVENAASIKQLEANAKASELISHKSNYDNQTTDTIDSLIKSYEEQLAPLDSVETLKMSIATFKSNQQQLKGIQEKLNGINKIISDGQIIVDALHLGKGVPLIVSQKALLKKEIAINDILKKYFSERFTLKFISTEKTFEILCRNNRTQVTTPISRTSGGESSIIRTAISLELISSDIVRLDEIDSYLDSEARLHFQTLLDSLSEEHSQLFIISHNSELTGCQDIKL